MLSLNYYEKNCEWNGPLDQWARLLQLYSNETNPHETTLSKTYNAKLGYSTRLYKSLGRWNKTNGLTKLRVSNICDTDIYM